MVYGAIVRKGERYYTHLKKVFAALGGRQKAYHWLITDCICYPEDPETDAMLSGVYCWLSGEELTELVEKEDFQWIWAVLSGFDPTVERTHVLQYPLPYADGYGGFWKMPLAMQHPLALYIFTSDRAAAKKVTAHCGFGGGCINDTIIHLATSEMGFGGFGESGMGSYHGREGFRTFSHYKSIVDKKTWLDLPMRYQPYRKFNEKLLHIFLR